MDADLRNADLCDANLMGANLRGADLSGEDLTLSQLRAADLRGANLLAANLRGADLRNADLADADLRKADLTGADLTDATLNGAQLAWSIFVRCSSLSKANGLDRIRHAGPSSLDHETLQFCVEDLPDAFFLGVGLTEEEIAALRDLYSLAKPISFSSCFISYSHKGQDFTRIGADSLPGV